MIYWLRSLGRNIAAGARLASLLLPVARSSFRIDLAQLIALTVVSALIDVGSDWLRASPGAEFSAAGLQGEFFALGLLLFTSGLVALLWRDAKLYLALPIAALAGIIVIQVVHSVPLFASEAFASEAMATEDLVILAWMALTCMRAVYLMLDVPTRHRRIRAVAGGLLLIVPLWLSPLLGPSASWWRNEPSTDAPIASAVSEAVLATQDFLIDHLLDNLEDERPNVTDLYFVAFAPDSRRAGFRADVEAAQKAMDEHWGTSGRSITLINSAATVAEVPFASVTYLRKVLMEIGDIIDPEDDVAMLYLAGSAGANHALTASNPPLELVSLTPAGLKQVLDSAGIRFRVVIVSSCYSGAWLDALKDDDTAIIASSATDTHAQDCEGGTEASSFGQAFFGNGIANAGDLREAFALAQAELADRGASTPVLWIGQTIAAKLNAISRRGGGSRTMAQRGPLAAGG